MSRLLAVLCSFICFAANAGKELHPIKSCSAAINSHDRSAATSVLDTFLNQSGISNLFLGRVIGLNDEATVGLSQLLLFETGLVPNDLPMPYTAEPKSPTGFVVTSRNLNSGALQSGSDTVAYKDLIRNLVRALPKTPITLHDLGAGNSLSTIAGIATEYDRIKHQTEIRFAQRQARRSQGEQLPHEEWETTYLQNATGVPMDFGYWNNRESELAMYGNPQLKVVAVDTSSQAIAASQSNAKFYQLEDSYQFIQSDMLQHLKDTSLDANTAVASNPPYVPIPKNFEKPNFEAVDGGVDGTDFLSAILEKPMSKGTHVALLWSSLSNPPKITSLINKNFEVLSNIVYEIKFGKYTSDPEVFQHLQKMREEGLAEFTTHPDGTHSYRLIGTVMVHR